MTRGDGRALRAALVLAIAGAALAGDDARGPGRSASQPADAAAQPMFRKVRALCIGVDEYASPKVRALKCAASDARAMHELFVQRYGYDSELLLNAQATKQRITDTLEQYLLDSTRDEVVIFYYAGHGSSVPSEDFGATGFILPHDADVDLDDRSNIRPYEQTAINMQGLSGRVARSRCGHVLLILDCCFSGFAKSQQYDADIAEGQNRAAYQIPTRQIMTAGTEGQTSWENAALGGGYFTRAVVAALEREPSVPVCALQGAVYQQVSDTVWEKLGKRQFPQLRRLIDTNGEFVFVAKDQPANPQEIETQIVRANADAGRSITTEQLTQAASADQSQVTPEQHQQWARTVPQLKRRASRGDPLAMAALSYLYGNGIGVERDPQQAAYWAREAYYSGNPAGKAALGNVYEQGYGVERDPRRAARLREQGRTEAEGTELSSLFAELDDKNRKGQGGQLDTAAALVRYFERRAKPSFVQQLREVMKLRSDVQQALDSADDRPDWSAIERLLGDWRKEIDKLDERRIDSGESDRIGALCRDLLKAQKAVIKAVQERKRSRALREIEQAEKLLESLAREKQNAPAGDGAGG